MIRRLALPALGLLVALVLGACGGGVDEGTIPGRGGGAPTSGARTIEVEARNFAFVPDHLRATAGEELALRLHSSDNSHDFAIDGLGLVAEVAGGETETVRLRIDRVGKYPYFCTIPGHRDGGMEGTITVR